MTFPAWAALACSPALPPPAAPPDPPPVARDVPVVAYAWDPSAGDPSVPADLGGPGFTGDGWTTRGWSVLGDPSAPQGGSLTLSIPDWPATLRLEGQGWSVPPNYHVSDLLLMGLLALDPVSGELVPALATHWQVSADQRTYRFRLDPAARWSDGVPVTADDVLASFRLRVDPTLLDPSTAWTFARFAAPVARSKYLVEVEVKEPGWRNLLSFATASVLPAHQIGGLTGTEFLARFQQAYPAVTGPYEVRPDGIVLGQRLTLSRRRDWWADDKAVFDGMYNLDEIRYVVVRDAGLAFEQLKQGELDYAGVTRAKWFAVDLPALDVVQRGLLVRRRFVNDYPTGLSGLAINLRRGPLADVHVRQALQRLFDRPTMIAELFYGEYTPLASYWPGRVYQNPANTPVPYDEAGAVRLLAEAGFAEVGADGLRRDAAGERLAFRVTYFDAGSEKYLTLFQEAARRAGIALTLERVDPATAQEQRQKHAFDLSVTSWGGLLVPNPGATWRSSLAEETDNNNVTGYANPAVDALVDAYDREPDLQQRIAIVRQIDGILYADAPYVLGWASSARRVAVWNQYGMPEPWEIGRFATEHPLDRHVTDYWWVDPAKAAALAAARRDPTLRMDPGPAEVRYWADR